jgi:hypothetical protein
MNESPTGTFHILDDNHILWLADGDTVEDLRDYVRFRPSFNQCDCSLEKSGDLEVVITGRDAFTPALKQVIREMRELYPPLPWHRRLWRFILRHVRKLV